LLDLVCNVWLYTITKSKSESESESESSNYYIYNIATDELRQIINLDYINIIMELLLENKLEKKYKNSDYEFFKDCLNIKTQIQTLQPNNYKNKFLFIE